MKNLIGAIFFLFLAATAQAQSYEGKGDSKLNFGYNFYGYGTGIKATYSYGLSDSFSVGAGSTYYIDGDINDYFLYARASFHLGPLMDLPPKLDLYPGIEIGYLSSKNIGLAGFLGVRYFFNERIGIFAELGSYGAIGLSVGL